MDSQETVYKYKIEVSSVLAKNVEICFWIIKTFLGGGGRMLWENSKEGDCRTYWEKMGTSLQHHNLEINGRGGGQRHKGFEKSA